VATLSFLMMLFQSSAAVAPCGRLGIETLLKKISNASGQDVHSVQEIRLINSLLAKKWKPKFALSYLREKVTVI
jgi:hypothetical protein